MVHMQQLACKKPLVSATKSLKHAEQELLV
jgi:hypothetical protein